MHYLWYSFEIVTINDEFDANFLEVCLLKIEGSYS